MQTMGEGEKVDDIIKEIVQKSTLAQYIRKEGILLLENVTTRAKLESLFRPLA